MNTQVVFWLALLLWAPLFFLVGLALGKVL